MNEITYYFGAGASSQSMPLVSDFGKRFGSFTAYVNSLHFLDKDRFSALCTEFSRALSGHLSFDTFFKKLYHQRENALIQNYKALLLIYFLFEHLAKAPEPDPSDEKKKGKISNPDPRYEALIAGLLRATNEKIDFHTKVNFITWNYDANLVNAIRNFTDPEIPLSKFIRSKHQEKNKLVCTPQVSVTHLNGLINHPVLDKGLNLDDDTLEQVIPRLLDEFYSGKLATYSSLISFSWENLRYKDDLLELPDFVKEAQEAVNRSSNVIISGYSFPLYNRQIDGFILSGKLLLGKHVYIQDPIAGEIKEILETELGIHDTGEIVHPQVPRTSVKTISNCSSFFVPNSIFIRGMGDIWPSS